MKSSKITGTAFSARRMNSTDDAIFFSIEPRSWDGETEAACHVRIEENGETILDRDLYGIDPLQALEAALMLVRRFAVMIKPDKEYIAGMKAE